MSYPSAIQSSLLSLNPVVAAIVRIILSIPQAHTLSDVTGLPQNIEFNSTIREHEGANIPQFYNSWSYITE